VAITSKGQQAITSLVSSQGISVVGTHTAEESLKAQCTEDYKDIELRNEVIARLKDGDIEATKRWYLKRFSPKRRLYLRLKSLTTLLPQRWMVALRRARRASR
jgi:hypothetical protein